MWSAQVLTFVQSDTGNDAQCSEERLHYPWHRGVLAWPRKQVIAISVLTWKNVSYIPTLFKVFHILKSQLPDAKTLSVCSSLAQASQGKWVLYHHEDNKCFIWIKFAWPVTALNSYHNITVIWKYKTRTKKYLREVFERMVSGQFSSICILSLIWHTLFQDINWSTDRVSLNQVLNVYDNHAYLFSLLWKTNNENRSANIGDTGLACLLKISCHFLGEALKWCGSKRGFD